MVARLGLLILPPVLRKGKCPATWVVRFEVSLNSVVHDALLTDQLKPIKVKQL
jgi:hypothetical protein